MLCSVGRDGAEVVKHRMNNGACILIIRVFGLHMIGRGTRTRHCRGLSSFAFGLLVRGGRGAETI